MGYLWNSYMRDRDKQLKAARKQRGERAMAADLRRLTAGVRCPKCGQEAYVAKYLTVPSKVPASAGVRLRDLPRGTPVPPTILCTCPEGHQYHVQNGRLVPTPPSGNRRIRG
jgi:hypothetical protein